MKIFPFFIGFLSLLLGFLSSPIVEGLVSDVDGENLDLMMEGDLLKRPTIQIVFFGPDSNLAYKHLWQSFFNIWDEIRPVNLQVVPVYRYAEVTMILESLDKASKSISCGDVSKSELKRCARLKKEFFEMVRWENVQEQHDYANLAAFLNNDDNNHNVLQRLYYFSVSNSILPSLLKNLTSIGNVNFHSDDATIPFSRVIVEKPLGYDYEHIHYVHEVLESTFRPDAIFYADHYLSKFGLQMAGQVRSLFVNNMTWEKFFESTTASDVVVWDDSTSVSLHFNEYGIVRDVVQNHVAELISAVHIPSGARHNLNTRETLADAFLIENVPDSTVSDSSVTFPFSVYQFEGYGDEILALQQAANFTYPMSIADRRRLRECRHNPLHYPDGTPREGGGSADCSHFGALLHRSDSVYDIYGPTHMSATGINFDMSVRGHIVRVSAAKGAPVRTQYVHQRLQPPADERETVRTCGPSVMVFHVEGVPVLPAHIDVASLSFPLPSSPFIALTGLCHLRDEKNNPINPSEVIRTGRFPDVDWEFFLDEAQSIWMGVPSLRSQREPRWVREFRSPSGLDESSVLEEWDESKEEPLAAFHARKAAALAASRALGMQYEYPFQPPLVTVVLPSLEEDASPKLRMEHFRRQLAEERVQTFGESYRSRLEQNRVFPSDTLQPHTFYKVSHQHPYANSSVFQRLAEIADGAVRFPVSAQRRTLPSARGMLSHAFASSDSVYERLIASAISGRRRFSFSCSPYEAVSLSRVFSPLAWAADRAIYLDRTIVHPVGSPLMQRFSHAPQPWLPRQRAHGGPPSRALVAPRSVSLEPSEGLFFFPSALRYFRSAAVSTRINNNFRDLELRSQLQELGALELNATVALGKQQVLSVTNLESDQTLQAVLNPLGTSDSILLRLLQRQLTKRAWSSGNQTFASLALDAAPVLDRFLRVLSEDAAGKGAAVMGASFPNIVTHVFPAHERSIFHEAADSTVSGLMRSLVRPGYMQEHLLIPILAPNMTHLNMRARRLLPGGAFDVVVLAMRYPADLIAAEVSQRALQNVSHALSRNSLDASSKEVLDIHSEELLTLLRRTQNHTQHLFDDVLDTLRPSGSPWTSAASRISSVDQESIPARFSKFPGTLGRVARSISELLAEADAAGNAKLQSLLGSPEHDAFLASAWPLPRYSAFSAALRAEPDFREPENPSIEGLDPTSVQNPFLGVPPPPLTFTGRFEAQISPLALRRAQTVVVVVSGATRRLYERWADATHSFSDAIRPFLAPSAPPSTQPSSFIPLDRESAKSKSAQEEILEAAWDDDAERTCAFADSDSARGWMKVRAPGGHVLLPRRLVADARRLAGGREDVLIVEEDSFSDRPAEIDIGQFVRQEERFEASLDAADGWSADVHEAQLEFARAARGEIAAAREAHADPKVLLQYIQLPTESLKQAIRELETASDKPAKQKKKIHKERLEEQEL